MDESYISEIREQFRERMYQFLKETLSYTMTKDDLDIMIHLLAIVIGGHDFELYRLQYYTMIDYTPTERLRQLGSNVGFPWNAALTAEQQRQYIKLYHLIRRRRSTPWSLENLARVFGQDTDSYYTSADLSHIKLYSYPDNYGGAKPVDEDGCPLPFCYYKQGGPKYPGDNVLKIPAMTTILKDEIYNTMLAGTRLEFLYFFLMGPFKYEPHVNALFKLKYYFEPRYMNDFIEVGDIQGYIPSEDGNPYTGKPTRIIRYVEDYNMSHYVINYNVSASMIIKSITAEPYNTGWIFTEVDNPHRYRGYIINNFEIIDDEVLRY